MAASAPSAPRRVLVIEDEVLIGMLLEDMLGDLGYEVAGTASRVAEASIIAGEVDYDCAILDVNLNGEPVYPVAHIIAGRDIPFVFATGYAERGLPEPYKNRPVLQKPFQQDALHAALRQLFPEGTAAKSA